MTLPDNGTILYGLIAFFRIGGILFALPVFGDHPIQAKLRVLMAISIVFAVYPILTDEWFKPLPTDLANLGGIVVKEITIGLVLGYMARVAFDALLMAASIVGYQMGFGTANLMLADQVQQVNGFEAFHKMIVMLIFLVLDLHIMFIKVIADTFDLIPMGMAYPNSGIISNLIDVSSAIFVVSLQLAAPMLVALMFTMAALGLVARGVPQMNVFTMSFPTSFFVGLIVYIATMPFFPGWLTTYFDELFRSITYVTSKLG